VSSDILLRILYTCIQEGMGILIIFENKHTIYKLYNFQITIVINNNSIFSTEATTRIGMWSCGGMYYTVR